MFGARTLVSVAALALFIGPVAAQSSEPAPQTIVLKLHPAPLPTPALKYHLLPELREQSTGNAALLYYRAFSPEWQYYRQPAQMEQLDKWADDSRQVPNAALRAVIHTAVLKELDLAARRQYCEWEITDRLRTDGIGLLLPDVQAFRNHAKLLSLRARFEIADGHFDEAARTLQTAYSHARHVGQFPFLIGSLVAVAIGHVATVQVETFIEAPGSPNLYWALTDLPHPLIDIRRALQGERLLSESMLPSVLLPPQQTMVHFRRTPISESQAQELLERYKNLLRGGGAEIQLDSGEKVGGALLVAALYPEARERLIKSGATAATVDKMPMFQVVLIDQIDRYEELFDEQLKWSNLPYWQAQRGSEAAMALLGDRQRHDRMSTILARLIMPAINKVMVAPVRLDCRIAALRCIEAIRLYATSHEGKMPLTLEDIKEVPLPVNPFTGKLCDYHCDGNKATLIAGPANGEKTQPHNTVRYELTMTP